MNTVFIDTSYLLALELANDQNHLAAKEHWQSLIASLPRLVTTSYVFDEVVTFFNNRGYHAKAVQVGNSLLYSPSLQFIQVDAALFQVPTLSIVEREPATPWRLSSLTIAIKPPRLVRVRANPGVESR